MKHQSAVDQLMSLVEYTVSSAASGDQLSMVGCRVSLKRLYKCRHGLKPPPAPTAASADDPTNSFGWSVIS